MRIFKKILAVLTLGVSLPVNAQSYVYDDSATIATTFPWVEIAPTPSAKGTCSSSGSTFIRNNNNTLTSVSLPFTFSFAGASYNSLTVSSNGFIQLGNTSLNGANTNIPLNNVAAGFVGLFPLWTDFVPPSTMTYVASQAACSGVFYQTVGSAPNRTFILEFNVIPQKNFTNAYSTFQVQIKETSNFIIFKYKSVYQQGSKATTGIIVNSTTTPKDLIQYSHLTASLPAGKTVLYRPANYLDHYEIEFTPDNTGLTCQLKQVKIRACTSANSPCVNSTDQASISTTVNLSTTLGNWASGTNTQSLSFTGNTSTTLSSTSAGTATISIPSSNPNAFMPVKCYAGSTLLGSCTNSFSTTGLVFDWLTNQKTSTQYGVLDAGATSNVLKIRAVSACNGRFNQNTTSNLNFNIGYIDPTTGTRNLQITPTNSAGTGSTTYNVGTTNVSVPMVFDTLGESYLKIKYVDAGKISITATLASPAARGTTVLISKPYTLKAYNSTSDVVCANGTILNSDTSLKFCPSSEDFSAKIRAYAIDGVTALPNFGRESALTGVLMTGSLKSPVSGTPGRIQSSASGATAPLATGVDIGKNYVCSGADCYLNATLSWDEVGELFLTPIISGDNYFDAGAMTFRSNSPVGRFYPFAYQLNSASLINRSDLTCSSATPNYNYMDEKVSALINMSALNKDGFNVLNYGGTAFNTSSGSSWNIKALDGSTDLSSRIGFISATGTWLNGTLNASIGLKFNRNITPDGPYNNITIGFSPIDNDGVMLDSYDLDMNGDSTNDAAMLGTSKFYFGRMKINNSTGSELLKMAIPMDVQYFNGAGFVTNTEDSCTPLFSANFGSNNFTQNLQSNEISFSYPTAFVNGKQTIIMNKPSGGDGIYNGSFDLTYNLTAANSSYLLGKWMGSTYTDNPTAKIILSRQASKNRVFFSKDSY